MKRIFDADTGKNCRDVAATSPSPVDYDDIDTTAWLTSSEPIIEDSSSDILADLLQAHGVKPTDELIKSISAWAVQSNDKLIIHTLSKVVKQMLEIYQHSKNAKLTTYALQRVFGFEIAAMTTYEEMGKELGITEQAVSKVVSKISDKFNIRSRTMHKKRDSRVLKSKNASNKL